MFCNKQNMLVSKVDVTKWYTSTVLDVYKNEILVAVPRLNGIAMVIEDRESINVSFASGGTRYLFQSSVAGMYREAVIIVKPRLLEKTDLRRYPRVPVSMEVEFTEKSCGPGDPKKCRALDLSGNGMGVLSDQIYTPGTYLTVRFRLKYLGITELIRAECRVARVVVYDQRDPVEYLVGLEFSRLDDNHQGININYVIDKLAKTENSQRG